MKIIKFILFILLFLAAVLAISYSMPEKTTLPVTGARPVDWHPKSFWYEPWGSSGVHKGIDIFGKLGTEVVSTTAGLVLYSGHRGKGGNVVLILGPKLHLHYYAHLNSIETSALSLVGSGNPIGTLGDSGNAKGKQPHLHYSIARLIPNPWAMDDSTQGYKKAFYIDPNTYLTGNTGSK